MTRQDLLTIIEEGIENGRIAPHLAAYIAAEALGVEALATGYDDRVRFDDERDERSYTPADILPMIFTTKTPRFGALESWW